MKIFILFLFVASQMSAQKYQDLILDESVPGQVKSPETIKLINENCSYLIAETSWHENLYSVNNDQCQIYNKYTDFAIDHLQWIEEVKITSEMDEKIGMEVEVISFYKDGQEVKPTGFLENQIESCNSLDEKEGVVTCLTHFLMLGTEIKSLIDNYQSLSQNAPEVFASTGTEINDELNAIKSNRSPAALKQAKELKTKAKSIDRSKDNATQLMPSLTKSMINDYSIIIAVTQTLKKMESGL